MFLLVKWVWSKAGHNKSWPTIWPSCCFNC